MSAPQKTNRAAEIIGGFVQALMTIGEGAAKAYVETEVPFFALPVIKQIFEWAVDSWGGAIQKVVINGTTSLVINVQGEIEKQDAVNAATALQLAQASGDKKAIDEAVQNARKAYANAIHWDGTYSAP